MKRYLFTLLLLTSFATGVPAYAATDVPAQPATSGAPAGTESTTQGTQGTFVPLTSLPGVKDFATSNSIPNLLNAIYKIAVGAAAVLAVLQIIRAGVLYMGGDSVTEKREAKNLLAMSIGGLVLVLSPVILFSIINPSILSLNIGLDTIKYTTDSSAGTASGQAAGNALAQCPAQFTNPKAVPGNTCPAGTSAAQNVCCSGIASGYTCCAESTLVVQYSKNRTIDLISTALGGAGTDPATACKALLGDTWVPGTKGECGPVATGKACCVSP